MKRYFVSIFFIAAMVFAGKAKGVYAFSFPCKTDMEINIKPNPFTHILQKKVNFQHKIVSAVLAFPLPFGILGLHRIYLGTKPYVPLFYIGTFGGVFGILPFIDFFVLVSKKDFNLYQNNPRLFMWINDKQPNKTIQYD